MFRTNVELSELADRVDLLPVEPNPTGGRTSSWKILNEYTPLSGVRYLIHNQLCRNMGENNARGVIRLVTI